MSFFSKTRRDKLKKALVSGGKNLGKFARTVDAYGGDVNRRTGRMASSIEGAFTGYRPPARNFYVDFTGKRPTRRPFRRRNPFEGV